MGMNRYVGTGNLFFVPKTDILGNALTNQTPVIFADLEDVSIDLSTSLKFYNGAQVYAQMAAESERKIEFKAKSAEVSYRVMAQHLGITPSAGLKDIVDAEPLVIPASTPWTIATTPPSSGTFVNDLGVLDVTAGLALTKVASGPTTGQYSVSGAGVYTFAAADAGHAILRSFEYSATSTTRQTLAITNRPKGLAPTFGVSLDLSTGASSFTLVLNACVSSKFNLPFKAGDFTVAEFDGQAIADANGQIGYINMGS